MPKRYDARFYVIFWISHSPTVCPHCHLKTWHPKSVSPYSQRRIYQDEKRSIEQITAGSLFTFELFKCSHPKFMIWNHSQRRCTEQQYWGYIHAETKADKSENLFSLCSIFFFPFYRIYRNSKRIENNRNSLSSFVSFDFCKKKEKKIVEERHIMKRVYLSDTNIVWLRI